MCCASSRGYIAYLTLSIHHLARLTLWWLVQGLQWFAVSPPGHARGHHEIGGIDQVACSLRSWPSSRYNARREMPLCTAVTAKVCRSTGGVTGRHIRARLATHVRMRWSVCGVIPMASWIAQ